MKKWRVSTVFGPDELYKKLEDIESKGQVVFAVTEGRVGAPGQMNDRVRYTVVSYEEGGEAFMKPITTWEELGEVEVLIRKSERQMTLRRVLALVRSHGSETIIQGRPDPVIDAYVDGSHEGYRTAVEQIATALEQELEDLNGSPHRDV
jgi:hypothetical protein